MENKVKNQKHFWDKELEGLVEKSGKPTETYA
jgi:hypothetical protein